MSVKIMKKTVKNLTWICVFTTIIMFTNKEIKNLRDKFAFSIIELLLFLKRNGLETSDLTPGEIQEIIRFNDFLSEDYPINKQIINIITT